MNNNLPFTDITKRDDGVWVFTWASTGADAYRIVYRGFEDVTIPTTGAAEYSYPFTYIPDSKYPPQIEVVEEGVLAATEDNIVRLRIQWYAVPKAVAYQVQQWDGAAWNKVQTVPATDNVFVYEAFTPLLDDQTEYQYRVVAIDLTLQISAGLDFTINVIRPPAFSETEVDVYYTAAGTTITVEDAP